MFSSDNTDDRILEELGRRLTRHRITRGLTQAQLAREAGISKRTVERVEAGASAQLSSLIRILRILDLLPGLESLVPDQRPSPIELLKRQGRKRQRASSRGRKPETSSEWRWGEDS